MKRFSFRLGLKFHAGDQIWTVVRRLLSGALQLEAKDGELVAASEAEILASCSSGAWQVDTSGMDEPIIEVRAPRDLSSFSAAAQAKAARRQRYLNRLMVDGDLTFNFVRLRQQLAEIAKEIGDSAPPSPISIYRWYRRHKNSGSIVDLADRDESKGRRVKWSAEVMGVIQQAIETVYLNRQKHPGKAVYDEVHRKLLQLQKARPEGADELRIPSKVTIHRYLRRLDRYSVDAARLGKRAADRNYRAVLGMQKAERLLERWEIDHTPLDLIVFDEVSRLPHGRPWLTVAIDKYSRMIVGIYIGFGNPSAYSVLQCLRQAILPKQDILAQFDEITLPWPARGIPEMIVLDNGMEFHSAALIKACEELNIQVQFCPAKQPEYKGAVERFFRTISQDLIHRLPGTTFSNIRQRGDYESEKTAAIGFKTLHVLIYKWIVEVYHQQVHRGIGMSPAKKWEEGERERIIEYPAHPDQLRVITGHVAERTLFRYGVEINGLKYNSPALQTIYRRFGERYKVSLKFYEDDVGLIHVFDPAEKSYLQVPAVDIEYAAGLTLHQHEMIRGKLREEAKANADLPMLLAKKHELQGMIDTAIRHKKMGLRKKGSHLLHRNTAYPDGISPGNSAMPDTQCLPVLSLEGMDDGALPNFSVSDNKLYGHY